MSRNIHRGDGSYTPNYYGTSTLLFGVFIIIDCINGRGQNNIKIVFTDSEYCIRHREMRPVMRPSKPATIRKVVSDVNAIRRHASRYVLTRGN